MKSFEQYIAEHLRIHCDYWKYKWIEEIQADRTVNSFMKTVCKISKTFFFRTDGKLYENDGIVYGVLFSKEGFGKVYKCGKDHDKVLATVSIEKIIEML